MNKKLEVIIAVKIENDEHQAELLKKAERLAEDGTLKKYAVKGKKLYIMVVI
jgi:hypothetical protein